MINKDKFYPLPNDLGLGTLMGSGWSLSFWKTTAMLMLLIVLVFVLGARGWSQSQYPTLNPGFFKGNDYLNQSKAVQYGYITGVFDGLFGATIFATPENKNAVDRVYKYTRQMSLEQIKAIVDKYLKDHPEDWHKPMNYIALVAIGEACPK
jgi:hypothetical protein